MTNTETKFRKQLKKEYPDAYIKKIPDYKVMGNAAAVGLPDYLTIWNGETIWYEIKSVSGNTLALRHFTDGQLQEFPKMLAVGAKILVVVYTKDKKPHKVWFKDLLEQKTIKF